MRHRTLAATAALIATTAPAAGGKSAGTSTVIVNERTETGDQDAVQPCPRRCCGHHRRLRRLRSNTAVGSCRRQRFHRRAKADLRSACGHLPGGRRRAHGLIQRLVQRFGQEALPGSPQGRRRPRRRKLAVCRLTSTSPYAAELLKINSPHLPDQPMIAPLKKMDIEPGKSFDLKKADPVMRKVLSAAPEAGRQLFVRSVDVRQRHRRPLGSR